MNRNPCHGATSSWLRAGPQPRATSGDGSLFHVRRNATAAGAGTAGIQLFRLREGMILICIYPPGPDEACAVLLASLLLQRSRAHTLGWLTLLLRSLRHRFLLSQASGTDFERHDAPFAPHRQGRSTTLHPT